VLDAALARLRPGGRLVATFAALDRAAAAYERLGNLAEVSVARGRPLAGGVRLEAENPVFVVWGPEQ
jgi:precorrin-6B C5,15-methyltransferase / cobalt-precorrin-6B C5,C15-methyltransferase